MSLKIRVPVAYLQQCLAWHRPYQQLCVPYHLYWCWFCCIAYAHWSSCTAIGTWVQYYVHHASVVYCTSFLPVTALYLYMYICTYGCKVVLYLYSIYDLDSGTGSGYVPTYIISIYREVITLTVSLCPLHCCPALWVCQHHPYIQSVLALVMMWYTIHYCACKQIQWNKWKLHWKK